MKALRIHGNKDIRMEDLPEPNPGIGEAKLRITNTSICATDIEEWQYGPLWTQHGGPNPISGQEMPLILGHEISGHVAELGDGADDLAVGDRVVVNNVRTCGACFWCMRGSQATCNSMCVAGLSADGGLAEYMTWPASHLIKLPDNVSDREAPLIEPATVAVHAVRRSGVKVGDNVAVIGCGTVGLLTMQAFRAAGARVIAVDVREQSIALAKELGADETLNSSDHGAHEQLLELTGGIGPDIVAETAGAAETPNMAIEWTRRSGTTVLVGIYSATPKFDFNSIVGQEKTVIGSVAASPGDMAATVQLLADGKLSVKELISAVVPLDRVIRDGFERMLSPEKDVFRILVTPNG
ncbi:MAG: alcohol dehydrogenase catalytic domain-containing protein [Chloroflexi bacterium]|nr:alcohol dehydrogenase catalytic domain-containing protein [Chloroflexota bacterium]